MSRIRDSGNKDAEVRMIALLRMHRITGWRRGVVLFGKPDFIFRSERVAVFVDGCFWHRHEGCKFSYTPKSRLEFWLLKFERNIARDRLVTRTLRKAAWRVVRIWECQLTPKKAKRTIGRINRALRVMLPNGRMATWSTRRLVRGELGVRQQNLDESPLTN